MLLQRLRVPENRVDDGRHAGQDRDLAAGDRQELARQRRVGFEGERIDTGGVRQPNDLSCRVREDYDVITEGLCRGQDIGRTLDNPIARVVPGRATSRTAAYTDFIAG